MKPLLPVHADDHVRGPEDAPLTIVQYGDYDCPHTRRSHGILSSLLGQLTFEVRFVFRYFPLRHLHANAQWLAEVAQAAAVQGKFWPMHDHLMGHRKGVTPEDVIADAAAAGVELATVDQAVGTDAVRARIQADVSSGKASGVHSTPTFFFNGALHDGRYDEATLHERIQATVKRD